jgi:hypothetical protein
LFIQEKLSILLFGICDYLDTGNVDSLENALGKRENNIYFIEINYLDQICDRKTMDNDLRIDLERSFYLFVKAV